MMSSLSRYVCTIQVRDHGTYDSLSCVQQVQVSTLYMVWIGGLYSVICSLY